MRATRDDLQPRVGQAGGKFMRHRRRRRLVLLADQHQRRHLHLVQARRADRARRAARRRRETPPRIGPQKCRAAIAPSDPDAAAWNSGANSRRIATSVIAASPLALEAAAMLRKASRPGFRKRRAAIGKDETRPRCRDAGSPSAARRSRHSHCRARSRPARLPHPSPLPPCGRRYRQARRRRLCERPKPGSSGTITRNDFDSSGAIGIEARAIRQQRVEQEQRRGRCPIPPR